MNAAKGSNNVWKLEPAPEVSGSGWTVNKEPHAHIYPTHGVKCTVAGPEGVLLLKHFYNVYISNLGGPLLTVTSPEGPIPVMEMGKHTTVFGKLRLTRNVPLQWISAPSPGTPLPANAFSAADATIQHITEIKKKKAAAAATALPTVGNLHPFVAKQLLEFAQSKHEMCPITAEEYITGHTAVMPCGHLFMQMAIEETFKKEPNKCPACRQAGRPTFV